MNETEFESKFGQLAWNAKVLMKCECGNERLIRKDKARANVQKNGKYICQSCRTRAAASTKVFSDTARKKISEATSYPRSEETKQKMSEGRKAFFQTPEGQEAKRKLSILVSQGHAANKFENAKRSGWYKSTLTGKWMFYGSSYELRLCWMLDQDPTIKEYETQIGYTWNGRGRCLDFLITFKNGRKKAVEVKPAQRLGEAEVIEQMADSEAHALSQGWTFGLTTEAELGMTYDQIRRWADELRTEITGIDYVEYRLERDRKKAKKHYDAKIATDTVEVYCDYCKTTHNPLRLTYEKNIERNGEYICEAKGGSIAGKKPKTHLIKENPYADQGMKECIGPCGQVKPLDQFGADKSRRDGYASQCKGCRAKKAAASYHEKKDQNDQ